MNNNNKVVPSKRPKISQSEEDKAIQFLLFILGAVGRRLTRLAAKFKYQGGVGLAVLVVFAYSKLASHTTPQVGAFFTVEPIEDSIISPDGEVVELEAPVAQKSNKKVVNDCAPEVPNPDQKPNVLKYIRTYLPLALAHKAQVLPSIALAQGILESRSGTSKLAVAANNHFGMKCFSKSCRKGHCLNFTDDTHKDFFVKFRTASLSWDAHAIFLQRPRYRKLKKYGKDYVKWAYGLKEAGYATDENYATSLIGVIREYELFKYDSL